jgi:hypothetical protein
MKVFFFTRLLRGRDLLLSSSWSAAFFAEFVVFTEFRAAVNTICHASSNIPAALYHDCVNT